MALNLDESGNEIAEEEEEEDIMSDDFWEDMATQPLGVKKPKAPDADGNWDFDSADKVMELEK